MSNDNEGNSAVCQAQVKSQSPPTSPRQPPESGVSFLMVLMFRNVKDPKVPNTAAERHLFFAGSL